MVAWALFMPMKPPTVTQQEHQVRVVKGKPVFYEPDDLKDAELQAEPFLRQIDQEVVLRERHRDDAPVEQGP